MPQRYKFGPPHEQLRRALQAGRAAGLSFDEIWDASLRAPSRRDVGIRLPHQTVLRRMWLEIFESTRSEWEAAFERRPSAVSRALVELVGLLVEDASRAVRVSTAEVPVTARVAQFGVPVVGSPEARHRDAVDVFEAAA